MIVRIEASGTSFLGAGKYYLHDKLDAARAEQVANGERVVARGQSDERVWFTDTRNCLNTDPQRALEEMWHTAEDQAQLKMQAGISRGGRKCEEPVKTISLSWHKDDQPSPDHMMEMADAFLKHMGWDGHQAVMVGHNDTEHRHIHIILNRIHPENGRTLDDYKERTRAQSWALAYEKEHENVRCEERELRAAKRERRAPELTSDSNDVVVTRSADAPLGRAPANDHLPHNVIKLTRPIEREFLAGEQQRADHDAQVRLGLKAEQRAEREAFFKEGGALFKAARHAVYDEVRKEYAPEWRQLYKDAAADRQAADAWSKSAVTRALYFAKDGRLDEARQAFADRDSVRTEIEAEIAERKADLKARQTDDLRERQREACDALREQRDGQYQDVLLRQRYERGAIGAATTLEALGHAPSQPQAPANQNDSAAAQPQPTLQPTLEQPNSLEIATTLIENGNAALFKDVLTEIDKAIPDEHGTVLHPPIVPTDNAPAVTHQLTDLAAGGIGQAASYLADQLGEMFAPTPPEVREAQAKAAAKRDAEKPVQDDKLAGYAGQIDGALRLIEQERREREGRAYWEDRDRGKGFERDQ